jgi:hypothetical protein
MHVTDVREKNLRNKNDLGIYICLRYLDKCAGYLDRKTITLHKLYGKSYCTGVTLCRKTREGFSS